MHTIPYLLFVISYWGFLTSGVDGDFQAQCSLPGYVTRFDCHPDEWANKDDCLARECCWSETPDGSLSGIPACYFPTNYPAYKVKSSTVTSRGLVVDLVKPGRLYSVEEVDQVRLELRDETPTRLRIRVTMPTDEKRWEPPIPLDPMDPLPFKKQYSVEIEKENFGLIIKRGDDFLLDSTGPLASSFIISDQFLQMAFRVNAQKGFGPGETRSSFPNPMNSWSRVGIWARDSPPTDGANLYGTHNLFMGLNPDGKAFGIFLLNSNAQEVAITPLPAVTFRTIGGILDFFVFTGPSPLEVISQYYTLIGRPVLPPYWALGFHICRYGYKDLNEVNQTLQRNLEANIPIDAQWFDIDYMDGYKVWTIDPVNFRGLGDYVRDTLHKQNGIKSVIILDPAISTKGGDCYPPFITGLEMGIFINSSGSDQPIRGTVWPGETVFPDFAHPRAEEWWGSSARAFHNEVPYDGLWVDMNEPASFNDGSIGGCSAENSLNRPGFVPTILDRSLFARTLCPSAMHYDTNHYNRHNLYGYEHARVTHNVLKAILPSKRPFVLSRSTFSGSGKYAIHWTGDNLASWKDMKASVAQVINFNIFGIPMVGADICGFRGNTYEELCVRWSQLGAFYPFSRNHNELSATPQDPAVWGKQAVAAIRDAIKLRYHLLPYLYSLFYRSHLNGSAVARALAFEFPKDLSTHSIDTQFMLGPCILITPVLDEGRTGVEGYVPAGEWINLSTGRRIVSNGKMHYFRAPLNVIPILVRGGCILPLQTSAETTSVARGKGFSLLVVLSTADSGSTKGSVASGELFWDDGESQSAAYVHINFSVVNQHLSIHSGNLKNSEKPNVDAKEMILNNILINGIIQEPTSVLMNKQPIEFKYEDQMNIVSIKCTQTVLISDMIDVEWSF